MYNMLFGTNDKASVLLACIGVSPNSIPRFRDCYIENGKIVIYTRTGGGNREFYESQESCRDNYPEYFDGKEDPSGPWNSDLRKSQHFLYDQDDDYDCTYAYFFYKFPEEYQKELQHLEANAPDMAPSEKWNHLLKSLSPNDH
jgi:hypothetical protein